MHPSFEDRPGAPDPVIAAVPPAAGDHLAAAWEQTLARAWPQPPAVAHLHHLTPIHEAVARRFPGVPIVTHLHGTEILLLEHIDRLRGLAGLLGTDLAGMAESGGRAASGADLDPEERRMLRETRWEQWRFGDHWARRLRHAARACRAASSRSRHTCETRRAACSTSLPRRSSRSPTASTSSASTAGRWTAPSGWRCWRHWLVEEPQGWDESGEQGSIRYRDEDLHWFEADGQGDHAPVLLFVGRFTEVKRVPLLIRAYARAREKFTTRAPLVLWGGFPGEWEGEHPYAVAREVGEAGIFFVGWRGHTELPEGLTCADVMVAPSAREGFGQMLIEAMSCGVPVIATRSGGPVSFVNTDPARPNGWLIPPDDIDALVDALVEAVNDEPTRRVRGDNGYRQIRASHSWEATARAFAALYEELLDPSDR